MFGGRRGAVVIERVGEFGAEAGFQRAAVGGEGFRIPVGLARLVEIAVGWQASP